MVQLNDGGFKRDSLELGYLEGDISVSCGEIAAVMATAVTLVLLIFDCTEPPRSASPPLLPAAR